MFHLQLTQGKGSDKLLPNTEAVSGWINNNIINDNAVDLLNYVVVMQSHCIIHITLLLTKVINQVVIYWNFVHSLC